MAAKICVSIASVDVQSMAKQVDRAFELGADYVEIRFDFVKPEELQHAIDSSRLVKNKSVFTLRAREQGGKFVGSEQDRIKWMYKLAESRPMLLDVELDTLRQNDDLADFLEAQKTPVLVSWHDFQQTPEKEKIADVLSEMRIYSNYIKMVTTARTVDDSLRLLEMYETAIGLNAIFFAMGEQGVLSRVLCAMVDNTPFTYASLEGSIAPGQLTLNQMRKLYRHLKM